MPQLGNFFNVCEGCFHVGNFLANKSGFFCTHCTNLVCLLIKCWKGTWGSPVTIVVRGFFFIWVATSSAGCGLALSHEETSLGGNLKGRKRFSFFVRRITWSFAHCELSITAEGQSAKMREKQKHTLWALQQNTFFSLSSSGCPLAVMDCPQRAKTTLALRVKELTRL